MKKCLVSILFMAWIIGISGAALALTAHKKSGNLGLGTDSCIAKQEAAWRRLR